MTKEELKAKWKIEDERFNKLYQEWHDIGPELDCFYKTGVIPPDYKLKKRPK